MDYIIIITTILGLLGIRWYIKDSMDMAKALEDILNEYDMSPEYRKEIEDALRRHKMVTDNLPKWVFKILLLK